MKYTLLTIILAFSLFANNLDTNEVSGCNPPCPPGYYCDEKEMDCFPNKNTPIIQSQQSNIDFCANGKIYFLGNCKTKGELINTGFSQFMYSSIIYGIGTLYSSVSAITWYNRKVNKQFNYEYDDYYDNYYYNDYYYYDDEALMSMAPQSSVFLVFGGIQQGAKSKQIRTLKHLGIKPAKSLVIGGMLLYGASLGTYTLYLTSYIKRDNNFAKASTIISTSTLVASYIVNTAGYLVQRRMISNAVNKKDVSLNADEKGVTVLPYIGFAEKSGIAGLAFRF